MGVAIRSKRLWVFRNPVQIAKLHEAVRQLLRDGVATDAVLDVQSLGPTDESGAPFTAFVHLYGTERWSRIESGQMSAALGADEYGASEREVFDRRDPRDWSGWVRMGAQRRRPDLTHDEFIAHWTSEHARLVRLHHPAVGRYAQSVIEWFCDGAPDIDGFFESSVATAEDWRDRLFDSERGKSLLQNDAAKFLEEAEPEKAFVARQVVT